jgi:hypothetical protein
MILTFRSAHLGQHEATAEPPLGISERTPRGEIDRFGVDKVVACGSHTGKSNGNDDGPERRHGNHCDVVFLLSVDCGPRSFATCYATNVSGP